MNQLLAAFLLAVLFLALLLSAASAELPSGGSKRRRISRGKINTRIRSQGPNKQLIEV